VFDMYVCNVRENMWKLLTRLGCIFSSGEPCGLDKVLSSRHIHNDACVNLICVEGEPRFCYRGSRIW